MGFLWVGFLFSTLQGKLFANQNSSYLLYYYVVNRQARNNKNYNLSFAAKSLRMISHGGFEFLFLLYLLYLVAGDEERVLGDLHHRGIVDGIGIEIVDYRIGIHLLEQLDLSAAEAEVG